MPGLAPQQGEKNREDQPADQEQQHQRPPPWEGAVLSPKEDPAHRHDCSTEQENRDGQMKPALEKRQDVSDKIVQNDPPYDPYSAVCILP
ncbi:hypothetical protein I4200191B4_00510 [Pseudoflavonifractor gallinarum]